MSIYTPQPPFHIETMQSEKDYCVGDNSKITYQVLDVNYKVCATRKTMEEAKATMEKLKELYK